MHRTIKVGALVAGALIAAGSISPAVAAPGDKGQGAGGCVDQLHGNATNPRESGHGVIPSQSPGPWVNNPADPDNPTWGTPLGQWIKIASEAGYDIQPGKMRGDDCVFQ